jgi:hypothetical protein
VSVAAAPDRVQLNAVADPDSLLAMLCSESVATQATVCQSADYGADVGLVDVADAGGTDGGGVLLGASDAGGATPLLRHPVRRVTVTSKPSP